MHEGPFAERVALGVPFNGRADARDASHAFRIVWPPASAPATHDAACLTMAPEALALLVELAANGNADLEAALAIADERSRSLTWTAALTAVQRARRRRGRDVTAAAHDAKFAAELGLEQLPPALAMIARLRGVFDRLAADVDRAGAAGEPVHVLDVYDAAGEALGICVECGAWCGERHHRSECASCPDEIYWGTWAPIAAFLVELGDSGLRRLAAAPASAAVRALRAHSRPADDFLTLINESMRGATVHLEATREPHIEPGDTVRVVRGAVGEGYTFTVEALGVGGLGEAIVYGRHNYGPVRLRDVELVRPREHQPGPSATEIGGGDVR